MKKYPLFLTVILCLNVISTIPILGQSGHSDYVNITVQEAWELLSSTSNGIQIPIDVRTDSEWDDDRIDTPFPEFPRHFEKSDIVDLELYQEFVALYNGSDVIVYCKAGGRSASAAGIITSRGFNGTVYNVLGGITDWYAAGLPIKNGNDPPTIPQTPGGSSVCTLNVSSVFTSSVTDIDDDVVRLGWDWTGDDVIDEWTGYLPSGSSFEISHRWIIADQYTIRVVAEDIVGDQSDLSEPFIVLVNTPPLLVSFEGPSSGKTEENYDFSMKGVDQDDDMLYYQIDWGDGSDVELIGPFSSEEQQTISHRWEEQGSYTIEVTSIDEWDADSAIYSHAIKMPKKRSSMRWIQTILDWFYLYCSFIENAGIV